MKLTLGEIADSIHAEGDVDSDLEAIGYSIDSRTLAAGELFFAVRGERVDGHDYVEAALRNGAVAAVVSHHFLASDDAREIDPTRLLWVPESEDCVLSAMQTLARAVRRRWGKRLIGVTGSAGKTTTKEAIASVLSARFNVLKSAGNLNNHFGVPLQLLRLEPVHDIAVLEMGMNHAGEIAALAAIAEPDWAVVSNVAPVHLEFFPDGLAGIARAKRELVEALPANGVAFLNADDPYVRTFGEQTAARAVLYGTDRRAQVRAEAVIEHPESVRFTAINAGSQADIHLHLLGRHNVLNALAALAVGLAEGIPLADGAAALAAMSAPDRRGTLLNWEGATLINDTYNSNPAALDAMVDALLAMPVGAAGRRILVAGEMLELGPAGQALHRACGVRAAERGVDLVVGVRGLAAALVEGAQSTGHSDALFTETPRAAGRWLRETLRAGDVVLLKASRGVKLEGALEELTSPVEA